MYSSSELKNKRAIFSLLKAEPMVQNLKAWVYINNPLCKQSILKTNNNVAKFYCDQKPIGVISNMTEFFCLLKMKEIFFSKQKLS